MRGSWIRHRKLARLWWLRLEAKVLLWRVGYWLLWEAAWHWNGAEAERRGGKINK